MNKTNEEIIQHNNLRIRMENKFSNSNITWSKHYASLLGFGGKTPDQQLRNIFIDDTKQLNPQQLTLIYNDLDDMSHIKPLTQSEFKFEVFAFITKLGKLTESINKVFDEDEEINLEEITKILPQLKNIDSISHELLLRALETKEQNRF